MLYNGTMPILSEAGRVTSRNVQRLADESLADSNSATSAPEPMKECVKCHERKPVEEFSPSPRHSLGRSPYCKPCASARQKEYRQSQAAKVRGHDRKRRENPTRIAYMKEFRREHYQANRERMDESSKQWKAENPDAWRRILYASHDRRSRRILSLIHI